MSQLLLPLRGGRRPRRSYRNRHLCRDCGIDTIAHGHYYMVGNELWAASGMTPHGGMLCLTCLERRIGRPLRPQDFTAVFPGAYRARPQGRAHPQR
jgi:hypothetical protein